MLIGLLDKIHFLGFLGFVKEKIKELVLRMNHVSFAELCRAIPETAGQRTISLDNDSLIIWEGVSQELVETLHFLVRDGVLRLKPCDSAVYTADRHGGLRYPLAKRIRKYAKPRWYPVTLSRP
jgi:hypothetical protein